MPFGVKYKDRALYQVALTPKRHEEKLKSMKSPHGLIPSAALALLMGLSATSALAADPIHQVSSEVCKNCHQEIYKQWSGSMHAQSSAMKDPIHAAFYQSEVGSPTEEGQVAKANKQYPICLACHAPNAARDKTTKLDAKPAYAEGVNCVACHTLAKYKGIDAGGGKLRLGINAYEVSDKIQAPTGLNLGLRKLTASDDPFGGAGAGGDQKPNPHLGEPVEFEGKQIPGLPMEGNPSLMRSNDACMGCHDKRNNPHGVALCGTGDEYAQSRTQVTCISCHMPLSGGLSDHSLGGGHDQAMLERSVLFDLKAQPKGDKLAVDVSMTNQQPHILPTGAPFRNMYLKVMAYNGKGEVVWQSTKGHPSEDDPQAYMFLTLVDDEGKPVPPPQAKKAGADTRLKPHETRVLSYEIPAKDVVLVRGELYYNLLWPSLAKKFTQLPDELKQPVLMAEAEKEIAKP